MTVATQWTLISLGIPVSKTLLMYDQEDPFLPPSKAWQWQEPCISTTARFKSPQLSSPQHRTVYLEFSKYRNENWLMTVTVHSDWFPRGFPKHQEFWRTSFCCIMQATFLKNLMCFELGQQQYQFSWLTGLLWLAALLRKCSQVNKTVAIH